MQPHDDRIFAIVWIVSAADSGVNESHGLIELAGGIVAGTHFQRRAGRSHFVRMFEQRIDELATNSLALMIGADRDGGDVGFVNENPATCIAHDFALPARHQEYAVRMAEFVAERSL